MIKQEEATHKLVRSWRGCEARIVEGSVTLVPLKERQKAFVKEEDTEAVGTLAEMHKRATQLNNLQQASGFLDWLYYPVAIGAEPISYDKRAFDGLVGAY